MQRECRRAYFSGRVQGVGFRVTAYQLARDFRVVGFVRNLRDGRVELVVEGEPAEIDALLRAVRSAMDRYIRDVTVEPCPVSSTPLSAFTIEH
jgi:acylphosphatase